MSRGDRSDLSSHVLEKNAKKYYKEEEKKKRTEKLDKAA